MLRLDTYQIPENLVAGHFIRKNDCIRSVDLTGWSMMI